VSNVKADPTASTSAGVSTGKYWYYAALDYSILAGAIAGVSALGWYISKKPKKTEEVVD
jgi:hypothetical protein